MTRKLVTIRTIVNLQPIKGADKIELAMVDGWQVVVKKGEFKIGDKALYFEIDSMLPTDRPMFSFLKPGKDGKSHRLKTIKLKGTLSQGLLLPNPYDRVPGSAEDNLDDIFGVTLYEPPLHSSLCGQARGNFPSFIRKTDQERIQNVPEYLDTYKDVTFEVTIKLDGASMTVYKHDDCGICSRNLNLKDTEGNRFWIIGRPLLEKLKQYGKNIALQGELIGENIQGNPEHIQGNQFWLFDIWLVDEQRYCTTSERIQIWQTLGGTGFCNHVPCLGEYKLSEFYNPVHTEWLDKILKFADGGSLHTDVQREGVVFKSTNLVGNQTVSFKVISNKYLLGKKE